MIATVEVLRGNFDSNYRKSQWYTNLLLSVWCSFPRTNVTGHATPSWNLIRRDTRVANWLAQKSSALDSLYQCLKPEILRVSERSEGKSPKTLSSRLLNWALEAYLFCLLLMSEWIKNEMGLVKWCLGILSKLFTSGRQGSDWSLVASGLSLVGSCPHC